jgi:DNA uptake protein ComE-like DNA-binding protein
MGTASQAELVALPGIGEVYAQKIIHGRPDSSKDQLSEQEGHCWQNEG